MNKTTWNSLLRIVFFSLIVLALFLGLDSYTGRRIYYSPVWEKIQDSQSEIDCLILGNSHAYTSLDAASLSDALQMEIDVLGSSSQNMSVTLEAFKAAIQYQHPHLVILEAYSSFLDNREKLQTENIGILYSALDGVSDYRRKIPGITRLFKPKNWLDGTFQLFRPTYTWDRWSDEYSPSINTDDHGYVGRTTHASGEYDFTEASEIVRNTQAKPKELADYNEAALREFLSICSEQQISVILYKAPTLRSSTAAYVARIFDIADEYDCVIAKLDYLSDIASLGLTVSDFYDTGHMNRSGAGILTLQMGNALSELTGRDLEWNNAFAYCRESISPLDNGNYLYEMHNYSSDCLYSFKLSVDGEAVLCTPFSSECMFESEYSVDDPDHKVVVTCMMIPSADEDAGNASPNLLSVSFMKTNSCVVSQED